MQLMNTKEVNVLALEVKDFINDKGEKVVFARALIKDEEGKVQETAADPVLLKWLETEAPIVGQGIFEAFSATGKGGFKYTKLKLVDFTTKV